MLISTGLYYGSAAIIPWVFYNRYKYIEQSERYFDKGRYASALKYADKVYNKVQKSNKPPSGFFIIPYIYSRSETGIKKANLRYYQAAINYAFCLQSIGNNNEEAIARYEKLNIYSKTIFPKEKEYQLIPLIGCAQIYIAEGKNIEAEGCFSELLKLIDKVDKSDRDISVQILLFYSLYAQKNGDLKKAQELRLKAKDLYLESGGSSKSSNYLYLLSSIIGDYILEGNYDSARDLIEKSERLFRKKRKDIIYQDFLLAKSRIEEYDNNLNDAEKILKSRVVRARRNQGPKHLDYSNSLKQLALFYYRNSDFEKAGKVFAESFSIAQNLKSRSILFYYDVLFAKILNDFAQGNLGEIEKNIGDIEQFIYSQINENFVFLTEDEKEIFILSLSSQFDFINRLYIGLPNINFTSRIYNNLLATKSIALQSNQYLRQLILRSEKKELITLYDSISIAKERLASLNISGSRNQDLSNALSRSVYRSEKELLRLINGSGEFREFNIDEIKWEDVQRSLGNNEVAIEYFNLPQQFNDLNKRQYYALIITHNLARPELVPLFTEDKIESIIKFKGTGSSIDRISRIYDPINRKKLYNLIWAPLEEKLIGINKAYVSLSGILHQISFPAITTGTQKEFIFVGSTRSLAEKKYFESIVPGNLSVLYGGIDYNSSNNSSHLKSDRAFGTGLSEDIYRSGYKYLPETKTEIEKISKILEKKNYHTLVYTGENATEESFKEISRNTPGIIHMATHGFYYPAKRSDKLMSFSTSLDNSSTNLNPLYRSGLLLAGANNSSSTGIDDGILTAYEISKLDLHASDLVILSACETGLGDIKGSEGVYGLQRAFKLAGAKTIIISLWKVPDTQTSELMQKFYNYYLSGNSKQKSLSLAQKDMSVKYPPYYWAAFNVIE